MSLPAWQSKTDSINCWSLLAHIWRQEEMDMGLPREDKGTLVGTTLPLMGATQNAQGMLPLPTRHYTAAIEDVRENVRAKIYAMCTRIGFSHPSDGINTEDKITLCIVENYLDFKTGEVWYEVGSELAQEGLCPTSPDQECLQEIIHCSEERAEEEAKERQVTAIDASRPLNVTTFCSRNITIATSPMKILSENKIGTASQVAPATTS
ncbi:PREDICTED: cilia- and flagella-associated protein 69-like isoform X4 [Amphimedon queenslandica]|uniref:Cilia- and flagella-associated protein 69 ARM repeats domain-containing protein n=1 Tax=Amphimedon queenslandica TaxID=400682 RepID=A0AAN0JWD9_AMPQE|nr:PREDICTED: cilia- and flagella-associated protein 69-like isoform X4 [Amphimedon queenslandica]|eukprot:XP_019861488.1 PREDICTED: cilia- and flagella-associated protein 69-like isoform X4 [Amphimedon queenslandica]